MHQIKSQSPQTTKNQHVKTTCGNLEKIIPSDINKKCPKIKCPIFLRKTHSMINTCDSNIALWSDDGNSFIIKDQHLFVSTIIPQYFKHSNLHSFIRQLNLYGFKKIKADDTAPSLDGKKAKYMRFCHKNFIRGRPDLLTKILRPIPRVSLDEQKINSLEVEVNDLKDSVASMANNITQVKEITHRALDLLNNHYQRMNAIAPKKTKKRKMIMETNDYITSCRLSFTSDITSSPDLNLERNHLDRRSVSISHKYTKSLHISNELIGNKKESGGVSVPQSHENNSNSILDIIKDSEDECRKEIKKFVESIGDLMDEDATYPFLEASENICDDNKRNNKIYNYLCEMDEMASDVLY